MGSPTGWVSGIKMRGLSLVSVKGRGPWPSPGHPHPPPHNPGITSSRDMMVPPPGLRRGMSPECQGLTAPQPHADAVAALPEPSLAGPGSARPPLSAAPAHDPRERGCRPRRRPGGRPPAAGGPGPPGLQEVAGQPGKRAPHSEGAGPAPGRRRTAGGRPTPPPLRRGHGQDERPPRGSAQGERRAEKRPHHRCADEAGREFCESPPGGCLMTPAGCRPLGTRISATGDSRRQCPLRMVPMSAAMAPQMAAARPTPTVTNRNRPVSSCRRQSPGIAQNQEDAGHNAGPGGGHRGRRHRPGADGSTGPAPQLHSTPQP